MRRGWSTRPAPSATDPAQFDNFIRRRSYRQGILFDTRSSTGRPIYHTNVLLSLGDRYAVVCGESIPDAAQRSRVVESLRRSFDLIEISMAQMEQHFCGNILQLRNRAGEPLVVMSVRAEQGFTPEQRRRLAGFGKILSVDLETIETVGGGSARCMLAEVFSPRVEGGTAPFVRQLAGPACRAELGGWWDRLEKPFRPASAGRTLPRAKACAFGRRRR